MLYRHLRGIRTYCSHRTTGMQQETLNGRVRRIQGAARSVSNRGHFKIAVIFNCTGLDRSRRLNRPANAPRPGFMLVMRLQSSMTTSSGENSRTPGTEPSFAAHLRA